MEKASARRSYVPWGLRHTQEGAQLSRGGCDLSISHCPHTGEHDVQIRLRPCREHAVAQACGEFTEAC